MTTIIFISKTIFSIIIGLLAGLLTIHVFNRIPPKWLSDYNQEPEKSMWGERIKKRPWDMVFILVFTGASLKLMNQGVIYQIAGMFALWFLLQIAIADKKYRIIPDQFIIALGVAAIGFIPFQNSYLSPLYGALIGGGSFLLIGVLGQLIFKKETIGFGDVKMLAAIGLITGPKGIIIIILFTVFSSAAVFGWGLIKGSIKKEDEKPLGPFIAAGTSVYILFYHEIMKLLLLYYTCSGL